MIPISLKLSNFTSYGEHVAALNFEKFHLAAISGPNGAGKSSLLDAITWALWGWSRSGDTSDGLIRLGKSDMYVEFKFQLDGNEFIVKRRRSLKGVGSTALELWSANHNLTEGTIKTTQEKIVNLLHLSFDTFINSSFLRQGHADEFTTKGPSDRKRILSDILGLSHYDNLEEKAKERAKEIQTKLSLIEYQLLDIEAELSQKEESAEKKIQVEKKITEVEESITKMEKELKELQSKIATISATSDQQNKLRQTFDDMKTELDEIISQGKIKAAGIKQLENELLEFPKYEEKLKSLKDLENQKEDYLKYRQKKLEIENQLTEVKSALAIKETQRQNLEEKLKEINSHVEALKKESSKCPTCGQLIDKDKKEIVKKEYLEKAKKIHLEIKGIKSDSEEKEILNLQQTINSISVTYIIKLDEEKYRQILEKLKQLSLLQEKKETLIDQRATMESDKKIVLELRSRFINKKSQIEKLEQELKKFPELEISLSNLKNQANQKETLLNNLRFEEKEVRSLLGQVTQLLTRTQQMEKLYEQKKDEKNNFLKEKQSFEELALAFGKKGIQAMIIETAIPEIEDESNRLLQKLTDGSMQVRFETQRETKTKLESGERGIVETLDIIISDEMGERAYENYSGGEQFRINIAIRLALSKLLTRRAGAKLQFLVIDEGFGTQDVQGRTKIVEVLDTIKNDFEKILIITHLEELKEEFPVRIEVEKGSSGSTFQVIVA